MCDEQVFGIMWYRVRSKKDVHKYSVLRNEKEQPLIKGRLREKWLIVRMAPTRRVEYSGDVYKVVQYGSLVY